MNKTTAPVEFVFGSPLMKRLHARVGAVAATELPVLIQGEPGVGKSTLARLIHEQSRPTKPFVTVNCKNLSPEWQSTELFGAQKGSRQEVEWDYPGKVQFANGGTLFVDELSELTEPVQGELIQILKERKYAWPGSQAPMAIDIRVIASSDQGPKGGDKLDALHEDWYIELGATDIQIPPLRERKDEIPLLCDYFLDRLSRRYGRTVDPISEEFMKRFEASDWNVENVNELRNAVKAYVVER